MSRNDTLSRTYGTYEPHWTVPNGAVFMAEHRALGETIGYGYVIFLDNKAIELHGPISPASHDLLIGIS